MIQIPNPAAYILQKALALKHRKAEDRRKDLAYVFEVAALWFYETERLQEMVRSIDEYSPVWSRWVERARSILLRAFDSEYSEGSVSTEQVYGDTADGHLVSASAVGRVRGQFLRAVFK